MMNEKALMAYQGRLWDELLDDRHDEAERQRLKSLYDETVRQLDKLLGPEAHCVRVDVALWHRFTNIVKGSDSSPPGYPPFPETRANVWDYLRRNPGLDLSEEAYIEELYLQWLYTRGHEDGVQ